MGELLKTRTNVETSSGNLARVFTDDADHDIVQRRLGLLYTVLGSILLGLYVIGAVVAALLAPQLFWLLHLSTSKLLHLALGVGVLALGVLCRRAPLLPRWALSAIDLVASAKVMSIAAFMMVRAPVAIHVEFLILPVAILVASMRAAFVPSPPRWTALVALVIGIPGPFAGYASTAGDTSWGTPLVPREAVVAIDSIWGLITVVAAYAIAKVVYGLRSEVKKAMRLGQYTLEDKIGEGGMGVVYRARHALLRRPTAIKLLSADRSSAHDIRRFEREVQLTSMLTHPNTVAVYDFGHTHDGVFYYAMEHLDGISLHDLVERDGPQPAGRVINVLSQIASALAEAHQVGLVHRDVKPANVFLCERGGLPDFVKVLDFGLVKQTGAIDPAMSRADAIAGTPHYMAPESIKDPGSIDARVDIYALGCVGYFMLTATTTFEGNNLVEVCSHHLHTAPEPPSKRLGAPVPRSLEKVILQCLLKSRDERPASARELVNLLRACQSDDGWDETAAVEWWRREKSPRTVADRPTDEKRGENVGAKSPAQVGS